MLHLSIQELNIIFLSAIPFTELRLSIPLAVGMGINPMKAFVLATIGNFIPIVPLLLALKPLSSLIEKIAYLNSKYTSFLEKIRLKGDKVDKYGALGLLLFVAVPFPGTGVYSGAILAFLFGIKFWYAFIALTSGMLLAAIAVVLASVGAFEAVRYLYDFEYLLLFILAIFLGYFLFRSFKKR